MKTAGPLSATSRLMPVAVIARAAGGVGTAAARILGHTHRLVLTDVSSDRLQALRTNLTNEGCCVDCLPGDLADADTAQRLAELCASTGPLRSIVNAAGLSPIQGDWEAIVRANAIGPSRLISVLEPLLVQGSACVLIASVAGHLGPDDSEIQMLLDDPLQPDLCDTLHSRLAAVVAAHGGTMEGQAYSFSKRAVIRLCERTCSATFKVRAARRSG